MRTKIVKFNILRKLLRINRILNLNDVCLGHLKYLYLNLFFLYSFLFKKRCAVMSFLNNYS